MGWSTVHSHHARSMPRSRILFSKYSVVRTRTAVYVRYSAVDRSRGSASRSRRQSRLSLTRSPAAGRSEGSRWRARSAATGRRRRAGNPPRRGGRGSLPPLRGGSFAVAHVSGGGALALATGYPLYAPPAQVPEPKVNAIEGSVRGSAGGLEFGYSGRGMRLAGIAQAGRKLPTRAAWKAA